MSLFDELKRRNVIRVVIAYAVIAWVLIQIGDILFSTMELGPQPGKILLAILLLGFLPAVIFAWAFEITPEGIKNEKDVQRDDSIANITAKKLDMVTIGLLVTAIGLFGWQQMNPSTNNTATVQTTDSNAIGSPTDSSSAQSVQGNDVQVNEKSIAVLPFANRSPNADNAFFADGMHDDLLTHLSRIADMKVISRTSVMRYANTERAIPDIANELGVATVMEGAVQRSGNRVRINVQLIDGSSDEHIWAEIYDRELTTDNIFDIQSEITRAIAAALQSVLSPTNENDLAQRPTQSLEAYDAYLQGIALLKSNATESDVDTEVLFKKAITADPDFAAAHAGEARALLAQFWVSGRSAETLLENAEKSLARATALSPDSVETLIASGYYHFYGFLNYDRAAEFIDRALTKAPNSAGVWELKGYVARRAGRFDETLRALDKALELDPLSEAARGAKLQTLGFLGRFEQQQKETLRSGKIISPDSELYAYSQALMWLDAGDVDRLCQATADAKPQADWSYYYWVELVCATFRRDTAAMKIALDKMPDDVVNQPDYPFGREFEEAWIVEISGQEAAAQRLYKDIAIKIDALDDPYPGAWSWTPYSPDFIWGLMRDLEGVRAAALDFETNATPDVFGNYRSRQILAGSLARAGDFDKAFDYLEQNTKINGYAWYRRLSVDPLFDDLAAHPRFKAMEPEYQKWLAAEKARSNKIEKAGQ